MASVDNLEIVVDVDIASAIAELNKLQEELQDLAESIEGVDAVGTEGIDIQTRLDQLDAEFAALRTEIETFEATNSIDIPVEFDRSSVDQAVTVARGATAGGTGTPDFGSPFMAPGTRGAARMPDVGDGMDMLFSDRDRGIFARLSRSVRQLRRNVDEFDIRMSDLHNMLARLVPLLLVFIGVIPAAVTALVGLASAALAAAAGLAAIAGFGALGVALQGGQFDMQRLTEVWNDIRDSFIEAFAPLAERLQPIFLDAVDAMDIFFQSIADQGDALMDLADEARAFGGFVMDFMPGMLRTLAALVEGLGPILGNIGQFINRNFNTIMRDLVELTAEAVPPLAEMTLMIGRAIPALVQMSIGFTQVANVVIQIIGLFFRLLDIVGVSPRVFGLVTAALLATATAVALLHTTLFRFAGGAIATAISSLYSFYSTLIASSGAFGTFTIAGYSATGALAAFMTLATLGAAAAVLVPMALGAASAFTGLAGSIDSATSSLKEFDRVSGNTSGSFNPYAGSGAPMGGGGAATGGSGPTTVINVESSGDGHEDRSNAKYLSFRQGRTTGGNN